MIRRDFLALSGKAGAAACLPLSAFPLNYSISETEPKFKMGYQLFSIRDEMAKDPIATLKALKEMGYEDFEHYGFDPEQGTYYGFPASEFKSILDDLGLSVSSGHYPFSDFLSQPLDNIREYTSKCIDGALAMGSKYITWPWLAEDLRNEAGYKRCALYLNMMGEQIAAAGLELAYHNHGYEFEDLGGTTGYDIITSETDARYVKLQLDMYWLARSSDYTPQELIDEHRGRFVMWHIKDMHKVSEDYTELGNGSIDYTQLLPDPKSSGLEYYYIEQGGNFTVDSMTSARVSAAYLKENLQKFL